VHVFFLSLRLSDRTGAFFGVCWCLLSFNLFSGTCVFCGLSSRTISSSDYAGGVSGSVSSLGGGGFLRVVASSLLVIIGGGGDSRKAGKGIVLWWCEGDFGVSVVWGCLVRFRGFCWVALWVLCCLLNVRGRGVLGFYGGFIRGGEGCYISR